MLVNLCHNSLKPAIVCNKPTYDGYEINNLIQQTSYQSQGFMVEPFIKPPVTVTLKFPCNVEIFKICINPFVGQQKSLGFEVHTKSEVVKDSWLMDSSLIPSVNTDGIFVPVGRVLLKEAKIFCFRNYSFKSQQELHSTMCCQLELPLKHHQHKSLTFVSHVSLRITQTQGSCVPCIGKLEIWAKPVSNGVKHLESKVYSCFRQHLLNNELYEEDIDINEDNSIDQNTASYLRTNSNNSFNLNGVDVPEDFLDPITCEIMSMPMLLPSGQSVDQCTLDNHTNAESKWGRAPNNLFTSVKFTSIYKPIPNTSLKVRIDKFLLDNCQQLSDVPRTVGRASDLQNQGLSIQSKDWVQPRRLRTDPQKTCNQILIQHDSSSTISKKECSSLNKQNKHQNVAASSLNGHIKSHGNTSKSFANSRTTDGRNFQMPNFGSKRKTLSSKTDDVGSNLKRLQTSGDTRVIRDSHENDLNQSLEAALSRTLGTLPSFRTPVLNSKETIVKKCVICQTSNEVHLYVLPCMHILCRKCLNSHCQNENGAMKYFCLQCKDSYDSKDIQRLYN